MHGYYFNLFEKLGIKYLKPMLDFLILKIFDKIIKYLMNDSINSIYNFSKS